jgi:hypothetical protein
MPTNCRCVWCEPLLLDHAECYECDGSGFVEKCEDCFGPECTACEAQTKTPKFDEGRLLCDRCYGYKHEEMR